MPQALLQVQRSRCNQHTYPISVAFFPLLQCVGCFPPCSCASVPCGSALVGRLSVLETAIQCFPLLFVLLCLLSQLRLFVPHSISVTRQCWREGQGLSHLFKEYTVCRGPIQHIWRKQGVPPHCSEEDASSQKDEGSSMARARAMLYAAL